MPSYTSQARHTNEAGKILRSETKIKYNIYGSTISSIREPYELNRIMQYHLRTENTILLILLEKIISKFERKIFYLYIKLHNLFVFIYSNIEVTSLSLI